MDDRAPEDPLATLFRREAGHLVSRLTRVLGMYRLDLAEDAVQDALLAAVQAWKLGLPSDPTAWLLVVARNRARDALRRERLRGAADLLGDELDRLQAPDTIDRRTDLLRLMFSCCHPGISEDGHTALILRLVCGFGLQEIAHAFLTDPSAMEKRLVRAKRTLVAEGRLVDVLAPAELRERLPSVLSALYLLFDAGYHGSLSPHPVRTLVCVEAIHLGQLIVDTPATAGPDAHALLALMCLHAARLPARVDADGALVPFDRQDRSLWDRALIERGIQHLSASAVGDVVSAYHLEGGIAAQHAIAESVDDTNWSEVVRLYDLLYARKRTPVVGLGRAVARARIAGPAAGIDELLALDDRDRLETYPFFWAALGDLALRAGHVHRALVWLERGSETARSDAERQVFRRRLAECGERANAT